MGSSRLLRGARIGSLTSPDRSGQERPAGTAPVQLDSSRIKTGELSSDERFNFPLKAASGMVGAAFIVLAEINQACG